MSFGTIQVVYEFKPQKYMRPNLCYKISLQIFSSYTCVKVYAKQVLSSKKSKFEITWFWQIALRKKANFSGYTYLPGFLLSPGFLTFLLVCRFFKRFKINTLCHPFTCLQRTVSQGTRNGNSSIWYEELVAPS